MQKYYYVCDTLIWVRYKVTRCHNYIPVVVIVYKKRRFRFLQSSYLKSFQYISIVTVHIDTEKIYFAAWEFTLKPRLLRRQHYQRTFKDINKSIYE